jgi:ankyrin repeat protein
MKATIIRVFSAVLVLLMAGACSTTNSNNQSSARQELTNKGVPYTKTSFISAAKYGKTEDVKKFLAAGMDVNANVDGTALIAATASKNLAMVKFLVENGADVNETNYLGSALTAAVYVGNFDIANYLIANGADVNDASNDGTTAMLVAAQTGQAEMIELLAKDGARVNYVVPESGVTPLIIASAKGYLAAAEQLIKCGANINYLDYSGISSLVWALLGNHLDVATMLLEKGANPQVKRIMISALAHGDSDFIGLLIKKGLDINGKAFGKMPYIVWCAKNHLPKSAEILVKYGANTKATDTAGCSALDYALINKEYDLVKILDPSIDISKLPKASGDPNLVPSKQQFDDTKLGVAGDAESGSGVGGIDSLQQPKGAADDVVVPGQTQETQQQQTTMTKDVNQRLQNVKEALATRKSAVSGEGGTDGIDSHQQPSSGTSSIDSLQSKPKDTTYNYNDDSYNSSSGSDNFGQADVSTGTTDGIDSQQQPKDVAATVVPGQAQKTVVDPTTAKEINKGLTNESPSQPGADPFANKSENTKYSQTDDDETLDPSSK